MNEIYAIFDINKHHDVIVFLYPIFTLLPYSPNVLKQIFIFDFQ